VLDYISWQYEARRKNEPSLPPEGNGIIAIFVSIAITSIRVLVIAQVSRSDQLTDLLNLVVVGGLRHQLLLVNAIYIPTSKT